MTTSPQPSPRLSTIIPTGDTVTIRVEDVYPTTIDDLWEAVTDPERLARWIAVVDGEPGLGKTVGVRFTSTFQGYGTVETCDPPHGYTVRVTDDETPDQTMMTVRLSEEPGGTRLVVEDSGIPADEAAAHGAGWQVHLEDLRTVLDGGTPTPWRERWQQLIDDYRGPRLLGTMHAAGEVGALRLQERYDTDIDDLWSAFTDRDRLARWLGEFTGDLELGGSYRNRMYASGATGTGTVVECEPPRRFVVQVGDDDGVGQQEAEVVLTPDGDGTLLHLEHRGLPTGMLPGYGAGTQIHLEDLTAHVAGGERCDSDARMQVLYPAYQREPVLG